MTWATTTERVRLMERNIGTLPLSLQKREKRPKTRLASIESHI